MTRHDSIRRLIFAAAAAATLLASAPAMAQPGQQQRPQMMIQGEAHNVAVGALSGVRFEVVTQPDGGLLARGSFDNRSLFGRFELTGGRLPQRGGATCYQFTGSLHLGNDGSGFPPGTASTFVLTFTVSNGRVTGVYYLGPVGSIAYSQYGIIEGHLLP
jgi:hypothetical protein